MPGFYCPPNTWQPLYCNTRYYCSNDTSVLYRCPEGYFCPLGSVEPVSCGQLDCPAGSAFPNSVLLVVVFLALFFIVATLGFVLKDRYLDFQKLQQRNRLAEASLNVKVKDQIEKREREHEQKFNALANVTRSVSLVNHKRQPSSMSVRTQRQVSISETKSAGTGATSENEIEDVEAFPEDAPARASFDISFENLSFTLPGGVKIIDNVTGRFLPGRVCAIMGPSGAGKTSLVSLILGKTRRSSGHIYINDKREDLKNYNKVIGFVPQEDIMLREMTVESVLTHSAMARLPSALPSKVKTQQISTTINFLELGHVFDSEIGDEENRGVSGGQRKRVNIGMELVADPSILILDEPTSGLDSSTSLQVCSMLQELAFVKNIVVIAIIHSPSMRTYEQFDDLMLLGKGGHVVYHGPRLLANKWFKRCGFPLPPNENPADYFMDCISGKTPCKVDDLFTPKDFFALWDRHGMDFLLEQRAHYFPSHLISKSARTRSSSPPPHRHPHHERDSPERMVATAASNRLAQGDRYAGQPDSPLKKRLTFNSTLPHASSDSNLAGANSDDSESLDGSHAVYREESHASYSRNSLVGSVIQTDILTPDSEVSGQGSVEKKSRKQIFLASLPDFQQFAVKASSVKDKSSQVAAKTFQKLNEQKLTRNLITWITTNTINTYDWISGIVREMVDTGYRAWRLLTFRNDPIRTTPSVFYIFWLCLKRGFLQAFKNAKSFFMQLMFHALMGMVVSVATQDFRYIGRNGESICSIAPASLSLSCRSPNDSLRFMGMLFSWGAMLGGITMALRTFGHEKSVFWREASVGLPLTPYYLAKLSVDIVRMVIASAIYSLAFILFFPFRSSYLTFFSVAFWLYFVSGGIGYTLSLSLNKAVAPLAGVGLSIAFSLFFSGALTPTVADLTDPKQSYQGFAFFWDTSAPRWAIEAIWIRETRALAWFELHQEGDKAMYGYIWSNYSTDLYNMFKIGVTWLCIAFILMKILNRKNM